VILVERERLKDLVHFRKDTAIQYTIANASCKLEKLIDNLKRDRSELTNDF